MTRIQPIVGGPIDWSTLPPQPLCAAPPTLHPAGWDAERQLTAAMFEEARSLFTPGEACHAAAPGFYRCCFAWVPRDAVVEGFRRLAGFVADRRAGRGRAIPR